MTSNSPRKGKAAFGILPRLGKIVQLQLSIAQFAIRSHQVKAPMWTGFRQFAAGSDLLPEADAAAPAPALSCPSTSASASFLMASQCRAPAPYSGANFSVRLIDFRYHWLAMSGSGQPERIAHACVGKRQIVKCLGIPAVSSTQRLRNRKCFAGVDLRLR